MKYGDILSFEGGLRQKIEEFWNLASQMQDEKSMTKAFEDMKILSETLRLKEERLHESKRENNEHLDQFKKNILAKRDHIKKRYGKYLDKEHELPLHLEGRSISELEYEYHSLLSLEHRLRNIAQIPEANITEKRSMDALWENHEQRLFDIAYLEMENLLKMVPADRFETQKIELASIKRSLGEIPSVTELNSARKSLDDFSKLHEEKIKNFIQKKQLQIRIEGIEQTYADFLKTNTRIRESLARLKGQAETGEGQELTYAIPSAIERILESIPRAAEYESRENIDVHDLAYDFLSSEEKISSLRGKAKNSKNEHHRIAFENAWKEINAMLSNYFRHEIGQKHSKDWLDVALHIEEYHENQARHDPKALSAFQNQEKTLESLVRSFFASDPHKIEVLKKFVNLFKDFESRMKESSQTIDTDYRAILDRDVLPSIGPLRDFLKPGLFDRKEFQSEYAEEPGMEVQKTEYPIRDILEAKKRYIKQVFDEVSWKIKNLEQKNMASQEQAFFISHMLRDWRAVNEFCAKKDLSQADTEQAQNRVLLIKQSLESFLPLDDSLAQKASLRRESDSVSETQINEMLKFISAFVKDHVSEKNVKLLNGLNKEWAKVRLGHKGTSMNDFAKKLQSYENQLVWSDISKQVRMPEIVRDFRIRDIREKLDEVKHEIKNLKQKISFREKKLAPIQSRIKEFHENEKTFLGRLKTRVNGNTVEALKYEEGMHTGSIKQYHRDLLTYERNKRHLEEEIHRLESESAVR